MYDLTHHPVVAHQDWLEARKELLADEKEFTRRRDRLSQRRRDLPWEAVEKEYVFEGPNGRQTLTDLFAGRSQLVVYHAMFDPATAAPQTSWTEDAACPACSFWMDNVNGITVHLHHRDVTLVAVSRAPYAAIAAYERRMGWTVPWYSSGDSAFNVDYGVSFTAQQVAAHTAAYNYATLEPGMTEMPGISVFYRDDVGRMFHTYSTYARGLDMLNVAYHYLDLMPKGRDEGDVGFSWIRRHDEYED